MYTVNLLTHVVAHHQVLVYWVIYLGLLFEGEFTLISTGILAHLGALNIWVSIIFVLLGGISKTFIGYALGEFLHKKFNRHKFFQFIQKRVYGILPKFKTKPFWSIFISKFIVGANHLVIIFAGYEKIDYKKYLRTEFASTIIWAPLMLCLGYFFSFTALHMSHNVWKFLVVVLVLFAIFVLFDKLVSAIYELFEEIYDDIT